MSKKALIVVDVQNDFCPGGALAVPQGDEVIAPINALVADYTKAGDVIVYTKDFHPADHVSFSANHPAGIWPNHCVQDTPGVEFHPELQVQGKTFYKAFTTNEDSYSGFGGFAEAKQDAQPLADFLQEQAISEAVVVGLALDYCVKATAIDAHNHGIATTVILDGTRAVNVNPDDGDKAIEEMKSLGITVV